MQRDCVYTAQGSMMCNANVRESINYYTAYKDLHPIPPPIDLAKTGKPTSSILPVLAPAPAPTLSAPLRSAPAPSSPLLRS